MSKKINTKLTDIQKDVIKDYMDFVIQIKQHPTRKDMQELGHSRNRIRQHFTSLSNLRAIAKKLHPEAFEDVIDGDFFTRKRFKKFKSEISKHKKFVVTTAVNGCEVNLDFLESIKTYCKQHNAALLILPSNDPAHNLDNSYRWNFDPILADHYIIYDDLALNTNLFLSSIRISAKQIDPITGLMRIGQRNGSFVYASPKQRLKYIAVGNNKLPHAVMTTGAITNPNYKTRRFMSERTAYISTNDHVMGAVIVELKNNKKFHFRQIQANHKGEFIDLNKKYSGEKVEDINPEAFVLGDWHSGDTDPVVKKAWISLIKSVKPRVLVIHDVFNGKSTNPHDKAKFITQSVKVLSDRASLKEELDQVAEDLNELGKLVEEVVIVKSNHDEFLNRYLEGMEFKADILNQELGLKLAIEMTKGNDPLKSAVEPNLKNPDKFKWLTRDEDYKIAGIQLGAHGDRGSNGSKGSIRAMENAYGACVVGHYHTPEAFREAWSVGTSTHLDLDYNVGPSSWFWTSCLVHENGSRQLINCIDGECHA